MNYKPWCKKSPGQYHDTSETCEKCKEAEVRHRYHFGYVQVVPSVRYMRFWHLCTECMKNAKIKNEGKQHPMWKVIPLEDGGIKLELTDKLIWPDEGKGKTYGHRLSHPSARPVSDAG
jgi:hypothetical protein